MRERNVGRVQQASFSTGFGPFALEPGPVSPNLLTFASRYADGAEMPVLVEGVDTPEWQTGRGRFLASPDRIEIIAVEDGSSGEGAMVLFPPGAKLVGTDFPARHANQVEEYVHTQAVPSDTWVVPHNLRRHPSVRTQDSAGTVVLGALEYVDENTLIVRFSASFGGVAYVH
jgi:hypothetical protein